MKKNKENGRTGKVIRNTYFSILYKIVDIIFNFLLRTLFIKTLGITYLGIQGLFTNILSILSLMELGIGSAIVFSLYEPLAKEDTKKVASLMHLYKNIYSFLGVLIACVGIAFTPVLPYILTISSQIEDVKWIYWLTIANTSVTYFFSYKRTLLLADQQSEVNYKNLILFKISRFILLSFVLIISKNYILYLLIDIVNTLVSNIHISFVVKKYYPELVGVKVSPITNEDKSKIIKYLKSGIFLKIGQTIVTSTDSIIISIFVSTTLVGIYSNYNLIYSGIDTMIYLVFSNLTASVGNFLVFNTAKEAEKLFKKISMLNYIIVNTVACCMFNLLSPIIQLWLGQEYMLPELTVFIIVINYYLTSMCNCIGNFISAEGELTYKIRFRPIIEGVTNLFCSIALIKYTELGIAAVFLGTTICFLCGRVWIDPFILYKYKFKTSFNEYIRSYLMRMVLTVFNFVLCKIVSVKIFNLFSVQIISCIIVGISCILLSNIMVLFIYRKSIELQDLKEIMKKIYLKYRFKRKKVK